MCVSSGAGGARSTTCRPRGLTARWPVSTNPMAVSSAFAGVCPEARGASDGRARSVPPHTRNRRGPGSRQSDAESAGPLAHYPRVPFPALMTATSPAAVLLVSRAEVRWLGYVHARRHYPSRLFEGPGDTRVLPLSCSRGQRDTPVPPWPQRTSSSTRVSAENTEITVCFGESRRTVVIDNTLAKDMDAVKRKVEDKFADLRSQCDFPKLFDLVPEGFDEATNEVVAKETYDVRRSKGPPPSPPSHRGKGLRTAPWGFGAGLGDPRIVVTDDRSPIRSLRATGPWPVTPTAACSTQYTVRTYWGPKLQRVGGKI